MSIESILEKLEEETKKPEFKKHIYIDTSSEIDVLNVYDSTNYDAEYFEDEEYDDLEKLDGFPTEGEPWEDALDAHISNKWYDFEDDFKRIAKMEDGKLVLYRTITVESIPKFLYFLKKGKSLRGFKGIGIYWSWNESKSEAHWGHGKYSKKSITIEGLVNPNDINYKSTIAKNLHPSIGEEEAEIEVKKGAIITVKNIYSIDDKVIWKGITKLAANTIKGSFLKKVALASDIKISVEDVYANDAQYQQFLNSAVDLLYKFAGKFNLSEEKMLEIFIKHLKKDI